MESFTNRVVMVIIMLNYVQINITDGKSLKRRCIKPFNINVLHN